MPDLELLESALGVEFPDRTMLERALVHRSYLNENPSYELGSNERLEFLGDAVLGAVSAEYLYLHFPDFSEGELTSLRAALVRTETLARWARLYSLGEYMLMGRGEVSTGGRNRDTVLAGAFEALLAGIYLTLGIDKVRHFLAEHLAPELERVVAGGLHKDYKSVLQETAQRRLRTTPRYLTVKSYGPDHAKRFVVEVVVGDRALAKGSGGSKQAAQQEAAKQALIVLEREMA